jgi:hypothetical protein
VFLAKTFNQTASFLPRLERIIIKTLCNNYALERLSRRALCCACFRSRCGRGSAVRVSPAGDEFGGGHPPPLAAAATSRTSTRYRPWWATGRAMEWEFVGNLEIFPTILAGEMTLEAAAEAEEASRRCDTHLFLCLPRLFRRFHPRCHSICSNIALILAPCRHFLRNPL